MEVVQIISLLDLNANLSLFWRVHVLIGQRGMNGRAWLRVRTS